MDKFRYLIEIQFLGFRFSGWQKQPNGKTIQEMVDKTISFILGDGVHKTLGAGRTDAKVSANLFALELFTKIELNEDDFLNDLNLNLPPDIRALSVGAVGVDFNIIHDTKIKEYLYIFTTGEKPHPYSAPFIVHFKDDLDIDLMKAGARLFEGTHNLKNYCYKPKEKTNFIRNILKCELTENDLFTANFFPEKSWILHIHGHGFMYHQVRLMMGDLVRLGRGEVTLGWLEKSLEGNVRLEDGLIVPSSGLMLNKLHF